eukprot:g1447.t1
MIISDISFSTPSGPVSLNIGHRMYPEVFSDFPDLKQVYLMEQDLRVYADTWYRIWRCRTHAAASEASAYTQWRRPVRLQFDHEKGRFTCNILLQQSESENTRPEAGYLVILRATEDGREAFLYGELDKCKPAQTQYKTKMCRNPNCRRQNCDFLHPGEEHEGVIAVIRPFFLRTCLVGSTLRLEEQRRLLESLNASRGGAAFQIQLVGVPVVDRQNLNLVKQLPAKLDTRQGRESPVAAHLTLGFASNSGNLVDSGV